MLYQEIAAVIANRPGKRSRRETDLKIKSHVRDFQLIWEESSPARLKFRDNTSGDEVIIRPRWTAPIIDVRTHDDPKYYKDIFKLIGKDNL